MCLPLIIHHECLLLPITSASFTLMLRATRPYSLIVLELHDLVTLFFARVHEQSKSDISLSTKSMIVLDVYAKSPTVQDMLCR